MRRMFVPLIALLAFATTASAQASTIKIFNTPSHLIKASALHPEDLDDGKLVTRAVLPDNYSSRSCWPALYLLHGTGNGDKDRASTEWIVDGEVDKANVPAILIIPGGGQTWYTDQWSNGARGPAWESWFLREVMPLMEKKLHICKGRSNHAIAGLSMGGYGALYFASQRPDYFGAAASFSGVIAPERPEWSNLFDRFTQLYGPPGAFYAVGHDPVALAKNLRNTRVLVETGDGNPLGTETVPPAAKLEELAFKVQSLDFVKAAKAQKVNVRFEQHGGGHTWANWQLDFKRMLAWNPFKKVVAAPKRWSLLTSARDGVAWGTTWRFEKLPSTLTQFSLSKGVLTVAGKGRVTLTPAHGKPIKVTLPVTLRKGKAHPAKGVKVPTAPDAVIKPIALKITPATPVGTAPVAVSFTTTEKLSASQQYTVVLYPTSGCTQLEGAYAVQPAKGKKVAVTLTPATSADPAAPWCKGTAVVVVLVTPKGSTVANLDIASALGQLKATKTITVGA
jgi:S-formylglutathione hydrolase FrmB